MNSRILAVSALAVLTAIAVGCGSSNSSAAKNGRFDPVPGFGGHGNPSGDDDDDGVTPGDDDDDGSTNPEVTPTPDPTVCTPTPEDADCDGIPDDVDNIPCQSYTLFLTNTDVSSATVLLNNVEILGTNDFPSDDVIELKINPVIGVNDLTVGGKVAGSPGDTLNFLTMDGDGALIFEQTVTRGNGQPQAVSLQFTLDVSCDSAP